MTELSNVVQQLRDDSQKRARREAADKLQGARSVAHHAVEFAMLQDIEDRVAAHLAKAYFKEDLRELLRRGRERWWQQLGRWLGI